MAKPSCLRQLAFNFFSRGPHRYVKLQRLMGLDSRTALFEDRHTGWPGLLGIGKHLPRTQTRDTAQSGLQAFEEARAQPSSATRRDSFLKWGTTDRAKLLCGTSSKSCTHMASLQLLADNDSAPSAQRHIGLPGGGQRKAIETKPAPTKTIIFP